MSTIYLCIVIFLLCLAVFDLFVGVSNDAVNFLQSAIGAKVAKFRTVLIIASCGVVLGCHHVIGNDGYRPTRYHESRSLYLRGSDDALPSRHGDGCDHPGCVQHARYANLYHRFAGVRAAGRCLSSSLH